MVVGGELNEPSEQRRLLRPDPGESKEAFKARVLAAVLGLDAGEDAAVAPSDDEVEGNDGDDGDDVADAGAGGDGDGGPTAG